MHQGDLKRAEISMPESVTGEAPQSAHTPIGATTMTNPITLRVVDRLAALIYHTAAGVKHLIMDMGYGETLEGGITGAKMVIIVSAVLILLVGVWIW